MGRTSRKWTDDEIAVLRNHKPHMFAEELAELLPNRSPNSIRTKAERLGISASAELRVRAASKASASVDYSKLCKLDQSLTFDELPCAVRQVILSGLLGDGGLRKSSKKHRSYIYRTSHANKQTDYAYWKAGILAPLGAYTTERTRPNEVLVTCTTNQLACFTQLREAYYSPDSGRKEFAPMEWVRRMSGFSFFLWWLDDGHRHSANNGSISCDRFDIQVAERLAEFFSGLLGVPIAAWSKTSKTRRSTRLLLKHDAMRTLLPQWREFAADYEIPKCMSYKFIDIKHRSRKLDEDSVRQIKAMCAEENCDYHAIAAHFSVHPTTIARIAAGKRWGHVK